MRSLAFSRAGAVAVVAAEAAVYRDPRRLPLGVRVAVLTAGSVLLAAGVALLLWTRLGPGPLDVLITAIVARWGIPITFVFWGMACAMVGAAWLLGRRPGPGTLILPILSGALLPVFMALWDRFTPAPGLHPMTILWHLVAMVLVGLGAGAAIAAGLGDGTGELLASAASGRTGRSEVLVRTSLEMSFVIAGVALGGRAGVGTLIVAVTVGPAVRLGYRSIARSLDPLRRPVIAQSPDAAAQRARSLTGSPGSSTPPASASPQGVPPPS